MCIHLGMFEAFIYDKATNKERVTEKEETKELIEEITNEIEKGDKKLVYSHEVSNRLAGLFNYGF